MFKDISTRRMTVAVAWVQVTVLILAALTPSIISTMRADAYTGAYITSRSITMETSEASATGVIYEVDFLLGTAQTPAAIVLQYCDLEPLIQDTTCGVTRTASGAGTFDWNSSTYTSESGNILSASTPDVASDDNKWVLDVDTPAAMSAGDRVHFSLNAVVNPDVTNSSFYVRILTFASTANADSYTAAGGDANVVDGGGVALSTANVITVTAKVQETLTFCVYTGANCAASGSSVSLGDVNGVLDSLVEYEDSNAQFDLGTNATSGAKVYMSGTILESGSNNIDAIGATCAAGIDAVGSEQFGFRVTDDGSANTNVAPVAPYDCATNANHSFDTAALDPTSTASPYGDEIAATTVPTVTEDSALEFVGNIDVTTPAGIYTATYDLVAAATF